MIWKILGLVGAGSFIINGLSVIADPNCITADFGGQSRIVTITCHTGLGGALPGTTVGMLSIFFGFGILVLIFWRNLKNLLSSSQINGRPSSQSSAGSRNSREKVCSYCKREFSGETQECPDCFPEIIHTSTPNNSSPKSSGTAICRYCKKRFSTDHTDCPTCFPEVITHKATPAKIQKKQLKRNPSASSEEAMLDAFQESRPEPSRVLNPEFKTCPMCAEDIKFAAKKCRYCQHMLDV